MGLVIQWTSKTLNGAREACRGQGGLSLIVCVAELVSASYCAPGRSCVTGQPSHPLLGSSTDASRVYADLACGLYWVWRRWPPRSSIKEAVSPSYNVTRVSGGMFKITTDVIELRYEGRKHVFLRFIYDERVTIEKIGDYPLSPEKTP